jgi:hypothetical protein
VKKPCEGRYNYTKQGREEMDMGGNGVLMGERRLCHRLNHVGGIVDQ